MTIFTLYYPVENFIISQTFQQHYERAISNGWCPKPGPCPSGIYYYPGIDMVPTPATGAPIHASQDGTVEMTYDNPASGYGIGCKISHIAGYQTVYQTVYGHMSKRTAQIGDQVKADDKIGLTGSTGNSTGPHLHFELRLNGYPVDPTSMLIWPSEDTGDQPPVVINPAIEIPAMPNCPTVQIIATDGLNIRSEPMKNSLSMGFLRKGQHAKVIDAIPVGSDLWLQIGYHQYIALLYQGQQLVEFLK